MTLGEILLAYLQQRYTGKTVIVRAPGVDRSVKLERAVEAVTLGDDVDALPCFLFEYADGGRDHVYFEDEVLDEIPTPLV